VQAQQVRGKPQADQLDDQPHGVEQEEQDALAPYAAALAVPERPVAVACVRDGHGHDCGDHVGGQRALAGPEVQQVRADVGDHEGEYANDTELAQLAGEQPEPGVQRADSVHTTEANRPFRGNRACGHRHKHTVITRSAPNGEPGQNRT
jgi:hypothetical protein